VGVRVRKEPRRGLYAWGSEGANSDRHPPLDIGFTRRDASPTSRQRHTRHFTIHTALSMRLPVPGSPAASWTVYKARLKAAFEGADRRVVAAFWLFGVSLGKYLQTMIAHFITRPYQ